MAATTRPIMEPVIEAITTLTGMNHHCLTLSTVMDSPKLMKVRRAGKERTRACSVA